MYVDDVVLLWKSERDLQSCLESYCQRWCLDINIDKTKTIIFNKTGKLSPYEFYFNGDLIENVKIYKYLGDRICKYCQTHEIEEEIHFLLKCPKYEEERSKLFLCFMNSYKNFNALTDENKFIWLLTNENNDILELSYFIYTCLETKVQCSSGTDTFITVFIN